MSGRFYHGRNTSTHEKWRIRKQIEKSTGDRDDHKMNRKDELEHHIDFVFFLVSYEPKPFRRNN